MLSGCEILRGKPWGNGVDYEGIYTFKVKKKNFDPKNTPKQANKRRIFIGQYNMLY